MKWLLLLGLVFLSANAKNSTDCAIFISAIFIICAMPEKKETP